MIGLYVHHHGRGHVSRAESLLAHLGGRVTVLTSAAVEDAALEQAALVRLPSDVDPGAPSAPTRYLHYVPLGSPGLRERMAEIAAWAHRCKPLLLVVDVSVEVTILSRLLGVAPVVVRQHGHRHDLAHLAGYDAAVSLLAPFPCELEDPSTPPWVKERTFYAGMFSRFDGRELSRTAALGMTGLSPHDRHVVVLDGAGGPPLPAAEVARAAGATPGWTWTLLGPQGPRGRVQDPYPYLRAADVVVAPASGNAVAEALAAERALVCLPQERPFDEQHARARLLTRAGVAVTLERWPEASRWPSVLDRALRLDPAARARLHDGKGARRAAEHLHDIAQRFAR